MQCNGTSSPESFKILVSQVVDVRRDFWRTYRSQTMPSTFNILAIVIIGLSCPIKAALVDARFDHACSCPSATDPNVADNKITALRCAAIQHGDAVGPKNKPLYHPSEIKFGYVGASPTRRGFLDASLTRKEKLVSFFSTFFSIQL